MKRPMAVLAFLTGFCKLMADVPLQDIYQYQAYFQNAKNMPELQVASPKTRYMWQNMSRVFRTEMILRDGPISFLPRVIDSRIGGLVFKGKTVETTTVDDYFDEHPMDAMVVVKSGTIIYEKYKTMRPFDKHNWFSTGKVISGTLVALLEDSGKIDVTKPVSTYLKSLKGTVWDTVEVVDVLDMATGLNATEHEEPDDDSTRNPKRGWFQWAVSMGIFPAGKQKIDSPISFLQKMKRVHPRYTTFEYNSINTWVLELIVEEVTGKPLAEAFSTAIWREIGAEADGFVAITPAGYPMSWGFTSSQLRDLARFGMIFTPSWNKISKKQIISPRILDKIQHGGTSNIFDKGLVGKQMLSALDDTTLSNRYQWDVVFPNGDFFKLGVGGQGLYISPSHDLVIAWFSTGENDAHVMARAISTSLTQRH